MEDIEEITVEDAPEKPTKPAPKPSEPPKVTCMLCAQQVSPKSIRRHETSAKCVSLRLNPSIDLPNAKRIAEDNDSVKASKKKRV